MSNVDLKKIDVHTLISNLERALWTIYILTSKEKDRFGQSEIANYLVEKSGIDITKQAVDMALKSKTASGLINKNKFGFKIMKSGVDFLLGTVGEKNILYLEAGTEYSAKQVIFKNVVNIFKKTISICDPYIDTNTIGLIQDTFDKKLQIRLLTQNIDKKKLEAVKRHLSMLIRDGYNIEIREYEQSEMHDRYIIDGKNMFLIGTSLNYLGKKDTFIIKVGEDMRQTVLSVFNRRLKESKNILD